MSFRILVTEPMAEDGPDWLRANGYEVKYGRGIDAQTLIEDLQDCDGVIPRLAKISDHVISQCPKLKVIARHGSGVDNVDLESCRRHGIRVVNTHGSNAQAVAEHTIMLILACAKSLNVVQDLYRAGKFLEARKNTASVELKGKVLGLLGLGLIGQKVASIVSNGFGMKVIAFDPYINANTVPDWIEIVNDRNTIFTESDFISIHLVATQETKESITKKEFEMMKNTAYIINTARGSIVNQNDLISAIQNKLIAGAGLDVTTPEITPSDDPLFSLDTVIMTPHCGGSTLESKKRSSLGAAQGCDEILSGKTPTNPIV